LLAPDEPGFQPGHVVRRPVSSHESVAIASDLSEFNNGFVDSNAGAMGFGMFTPLCY
jgi:hypothetical protein